MSLSVDKCLEFSMIISQVVGCNRFLNRGMTVSKSVFFSGGALPREANQLWVNDSLTDSVDECLYLEMLVWGTLKKKNFIYRGIKNHERSSDLDRWEGRRSTGRKEVAESRCYEYQWCQWWKSQWARATQEKYHMVFGEWDHFDSDFWSFTVNSLLMTIYS